MCCASIHGKRVDRCPTNKQESVKSDFILNGQESTHFDRRCLLACICAERRARFAGRVVAIGHQFTVYLAQSSQFFSEMANGHGMRMGVVGVDDDRSNTLKNVFVSSATPTVLASLSLHFHPF